ncbi:MAG: hypothetical protein IT373_00380 [Polyangiaceae bacterium]|nr:hypothetical protein [Polyangiaceae bacterium]
MIRLAALAASLATLFVANSASAQEQYWLRDRRYTEGMGYRVGDFELHPGIGADVGYDYNYFLRSQTEGPAGALRFRISPSFSVSTLGPQRMEDSEPPSVEFRGGLSATYHEFVPVSGSADGKEQLKTQRNVTGDLRLDLNIMPRRVVSGNLHAGVGRSVQPTNAGDPGTSFNRVNPYAGGELAITPGGGLFDWRFGYDFSGTVFETGQYGGLTNLRHDVQTRGRWRFYPRTALMFDGRFGFISYPSGGTDKTSSHPVRARIGINGLVTPAFGLTALVGWGASFYSGDAPQDFDSVIGQLELKFFLVAPSDLTEDDRSGGALSTLSIGFIRDFEDSFISSQFERDRGYAKFSYLFGGAFLLVIDAGAAALRYPPVERLGKPEGWTDARVDASLFGEYRMFDQMGINAQVSYGGYMSKTLLAPVGEVPDNLAYQEVSAFLGVRWFM